MRFRPAPVPFALMLTLASGACRGAAPPEAGRQADIAAESARLTAYLDAEYEKELALSPEDLTSQGRKEQYDKLDDRSEAAQDRVLAWRRTSVADMKSTFDYASLDDDAKTSYDIWALELERAERRRAFRRHRYVFARGGATPALPQFLINFHRVTSEATWRPTSRGSRCIDDALDQLLVRAKRRPRTGHPAAGLRVRAGASTR